MPWLKGSVLTYGSILMIVLAARGLVRPQPHRLRPSCLCDGRRSRRRAPRRHQHQPHAGSGLRARRPHLRHRGWVLIGRIGGVSPQSGQTANLDSITAVVIGGTSLFGGRGSIVGTLIGALIVGVFRNGLALVRPRRPLAGIHRRRPDHRRGHGRPVDQEGVVMSADANGADPPGARTSSSATAGSRRSTTPTST